MTTQPGENLLHYRLIDKIGEGGMGAVWAAEDTRLGRKVAVKILPPETAQDPERLARFEREARAVAALNHPNIITLHSVEHTEDKHFLTMELIEGRSLTKVMPEMNGSLVRFLDVALPLAEALAAAHQQGITHRDLKPDNVMITGDGRIKVLDFGLAKLMDTAPVGTSEASQMPTSTLTQDGKIMGTVAYMSPEQAQGQAIDHRSDIFSLGILFYEMATGVRPFTGDNSVSVLSSILRDTPRQVTEVNSHLPTHLARIIRTCLAKDQDRRYQSTLDLRNDLLELKEQLDSGSLDLPAGEALSPEQGAARGRISFLWPALALLAGAATGAVFMGLIGTNSAPTTLAPPPAVTVQQLTDLPGEESWPNLSPDGRWVLYVSAAAGNNDIYLLAVGGRNPINLTADSTADDSKPAFSPDGESIAFRSERQGGGLFVMGRTGESVRRLSDKGHDPSWSPDGKSLVYATEGVVQPSGRSQDSQLWIVDVASGDQRHLEVPDAVQPRWSPDGKYIAFWDAMSGQRDILTISVDGGTPVDITDDPYLDWSPAWSHDGRHLYFTSDRSGAMNLVRVPMDPATGAAAGPVENVTLPSSWVGQIALSGDGRLVAYKSESSRTMLERLPLDPVTGSQAGESIPITRGSGTYSGPDVSPDGLRIVAVVKGQHEDLVVMNLDGSGLSQITDDEANDRLPRWSPDGRRIAFYSNRGGNYEIWSVRPDGSELVNLTNTPDEDEILHAWSPDGRYIAYGLWPTGWAILDLESPPGENNPEFHTTPDGRDFWVMAWSADGQTILGSLSSNNADFDVTAYDIATGEFNSFGIASQSSRLLPDNKRAVYASQGGLYSLDMASRESRLVHDLHPDTFVGFALLPDTSGVVLSRGQAEGDIWMATLAPPASGRNTP